jgi:hypothetical protein
MMEVFEVQLGPFEAQNVTSGVSALAMPTAAKVRPIFAVNPGLEPVHSRCLLAPRCRIVGNWSAIQQLPGLTIGIDGPAAGANLSGVWLGDQNSLAVMDGDLRWTDLNLEWHGVPAPLTPSAADWAERSPAAGLTACNGVPCRERCGKPRLSVNGHHPASFALKIAAGIKGKSAAGLVPSLPGWMVRLLALYDKPEP